MSEDGKHYVMNGSKIWFVYTSTPTALCTVKPVLKDQSHISKDLLSIETMAGLLIVHFSCTKATLYKDHLSIETTITRLLSGLSIQVLLCILCSLHVSVYVQYVLESNVCTI